MKTLIINAHPRFDSKVSYSLKLQKHFMDKFEGKFDLKDLEIIDLYDEYIPNLNEEVLTIFDKQKEGQTLNDEEQIVANRMRELLDQFKNHKRVVVVMPMHNFNIPSKLKDYVDNVLIARETFKYTETGYAGLMNDGRKLLLLQGSGSIYSNNDKYSELEFSRKYLNVVFKEVMEFDSFDIVRAEGTATGLFTEDEILNKAYKDMESVFDNFYEI